MNSEIIKLLKLLKENPKTSNIDHLNILDYIYMNHDNRNERLNPIFEFYFNFDGLPILAEKELWKEEKFHEHREPFYEKFHKLVELIDELLEKYKY